MGHVIQWALRAFMTCLGVKGRIKCCLAHEHDHPFGANERTDIAKSQRLRKEGNAWINTVPVMRPGIVKEIEKVCISWHFENPETDLHIAEHAYGIDYTATWLSKRVSWLLKSQSLQCGTPDNWFEGMFELITGVAWTCLPMMGIHTRVARKSKIQWFPATFHSSS